MSVFNITEFLETNNIVYKGPNRRGYLEIMECLYCGSKKKLNVYIKHDDGKVPYGFSKCFKCGEPGSFSKIIATVKNITEEAAFVLFRGDANKKKQIDSPFAIEVVVGLEIVGQKTKKELSISKLPEIVMPLSLETIDDACLKYINKRGLSLDNFHKVGCLYIPFEFKEVFELIHNKYKDEIVILEKRGLKEEFKKILFVPEPYTKREEEIIAKINEVDLTMIEVCKVTLRLRGRVVFPVKIGNKNLAFVARDISGKSNIKVINSSGAWANSLFWNFNNVRNSREVVICEGIFSAISCGIERSIALLGKNINSESDKIRLLKRLGAKVFYIYLDTGATKEAQNLKKLLMNFAEEVHIVKIPSAIKTEHTLSDSELYQINSSGISICRWKIDNTYLIDFHDHRTFKIAIKLKNGSKIPKGDERYRRKAQKIKEINMELLENVAEGDFLDSNDLGRETNDHIISDIGFFNCN
jgi:hypothetical protein